VISAQIITQYETVHDFSSYCYSVLINLKKQTFRAVMFKIKKKKVKHFTTTKARMSCIAYICYTGRLLRNHDAFSHCNIQNQATYCAS